MVIVNTPEKALKSTTGDRKVSICKKPTSESNFKIALLLLTAYNSTPKD